MLDLPQGLAAAGGAGAAIAAARPVGLAQIIGAQGGFFTKDGTAFVLITDPAPAAGNPAEVVPGSFSKAAQTGLKLKTVSITAAARQATDATTKTFVDAAKRTVLENADFKTGLKKLDIVTTDSAARKAQDTASRKASVDIEKQRDELFSEVFTDKDMRHSAVMFGAGLHAGYYHSLGQFALSGKIHGDWMFGKFERKDGDDNHLSWGAGVEAGVHWVVSQSATLGVIGGVRFGEFHAAKVSGATPPAGSTDSDKSSDDAKKIIWNPYVGLEARTWVTQNVSAFVDVKYWFGIDQKLDKEEFGKTKSKFKKDDEIKIDGLVASVGFSYHM